MRLPPPLREPLVQFLAIGSVLAGITALAPAGPPDQAPQGPDPIVVTEGRTEQLSQLFERTWQRPPTPEELDGLVRSFVREEVLYRAGRELALGEDDTIVRRRVAQKMEFLLEPAPGELMPTEDDLHRHLATFRERFAEPARMSLEQIFIDPARHGEGTADVFATIRMALAGGSDPGALGDPTLIPASFEDESVRNVVRVFGEDFPAALDKLPTGSWAGPVRSPYGLHLIRIGERTPERDPDLSQVREAVVADWRAERGRKVLEERFEALKARYPIEVERHGAGRDERVAVDVSPSAAR